MGPAEVQPTAPGRAALLDFAERGLLLLLYGVFVVRLAPSIGAVPYNALLLVSESLVVLFILFRKPGGIATGTLAWSAALVGTLAPLLAAPGGIQAAPEALAAMLMTLGLVLSLAAKMFLNRSFGIVAANRGVKRAGPYRLVRHPMYLGYALTHGGFLLSNLSVWNIAFYTIAWTAMICRIQEEEGFLSQDPAYRDYSAGVRYRLVPGLY